MQFTVTWIVSLPKSNASARCLQRENMPKCIWLADCVILLSLIYIIKTEKVGEPLPYMSTKITLFLLFLCSHYCLPHCTSIFSISFTLYQHLLLKVCYFSYGPSNRGLSNLNFNWNNMTRRVMWTVTLFCGVEVLIESGSSSYPGTFHHLCVVFAQLVHLQNVTTYFLLLAWSCHLHAQL